MNFFTHSSENWKHHKAMKALAYISVTTCLLRWAKPIAPFPSVDDYAYIPIILSKLNPFLFSRDVFVSSIHFHTPVWSLLVWAFKDTVGLPLGFWLIILVLSVATVGAVYALLKSFDINPLLLFFVALLTLVPRINGIGRGTYGGAFGDAFHPQWLAICLLLWTYVSIVRGKTFLTGILLGCTLLAHPIVGIHGSFVLFWIIILCQASRGRKLFVIGGTAALVSSPLLLTIGANVLKNLESISWPTAEIIEKGYLFRTPHEYDLSLISPVFAFSLILLGLLGIAGLFISHNSGLHRKHLQLGVLFAGHVFIIIVSLLFHSALVPESWKVSSLIPYGLHLTRTSPLFVLLAVVMVAAGLDAMNASRKKGLVLDHKMLRAVFLIVLISGSLMIFVSWDTPKIILFGAFLIPFILSHRPTIKHGTWVAVSLIVFSTIALPFVSFPKNLRQPLTENEKELYNWVREHTPSDTLFIIPPGFEEFRYYALRSVYVDFKLFPASTPGLIPEWRKRMEQIACPDRYALDFKGWEAITQWDRTYYQYNTPERIVQLLSNTDADFFIRDLSYKNIPPYLENDWAQDPSLEISYANERFMVLKHKE